MPPMSPPARQTQNLQTFELPAGFRGRSLFVVQLWWLVQATFFHLSPQALYGFRRWLLRLFGAKVGSGVQLRPSVTVTYPWKVVIGDHSWISDNVVLYSLGDIKIGRNAVISQRSYLCAATHDYRSPSFDIQARPVVVEDEAWIAADVFVAPGVTVGTGCVVGARSSVFSSLPPMTVCVGSPAVPIRSRLDLASPPGQD